MKQLKIPAVFMRGGTSNAIVFNAKDLPRDRALWDEIFLAAIGSPDPYGRQLDGMGGGISSLSKVCVVGPSTRPDADIDYTFAQVSGEGSESRLQRQLRQHVVGDGAVRGRRRHREGERAAKRWCACTTPIRRRSSGRVSRSTTALAAVDGDLAIPGVAGTGAPVQARVPRARRRDDRQAAADRATSSTCSTCRATARSARRWSTRRTRAASCAPQDLGLTGTEMPEALDANDRAARAARSDPHRRIGRDGHRANVEEAKAKRVVPFIGFVSGPQDAKSLTGRDDRARRRRSHRPHDLRTASRIARCR